MPMRKHPRRRGVVRESAQNLAIRPFCEDVQQASGGWLSRPRPGLAQSARQAATAAAPPRFAV